MNNDAISCICEKITELISPEKIYLFSRKTGLMQQLIGFKLCVISGMPKSAVEHSIYMNTESEIPFDVVVYSPQEWKEFSEDPQSFASKILRTGVLLYEQKA